MATTEVLVQKPAKALTWRARFPANEYASSAGIIILTAAIGMVLRSRLQIIDLAMLFLLAVVFVAYRSSRGPALLACLLSIALFDFVFVPPYYTFDVRDKSYFLTFGVMLAVAMGMTQLTGRIREQAEEAREREQRTRRLYEMNRELAGAENLRAQVAIAERHISEAGSGEALVHLAEPWLDERAHQQRAAVFENVAVRVAATWATEYGESAGWGTSRCAEAEALVVPLRAATRTMGLVTVEPLSPEQLLSAKHRRDVEALVKQAATAFERTILSTGHERARMEVESERLRTALLSSLSHDLRTPLGSIEGAASSLLQEAALPKDVQVEMAETILAESRRMTRLVTNLLDMVRVESGALAVHKAWQPLEEALGVALLRLEERLAGHPLQTRLPPDLPLIPIDELLIEQVFINLLENAVKHTPPGTPITVSAWTEDGAVVVEVADRGPGIPAGEEESIFRKFHRGSVTARATPAGGSGLGLTICRGIIAAHGGRIWLHRSQQPGAAFRLTLPLEGLPPAALPSEDTEPGA